MSPAEEREALARLGEEIQTLVTDHPAGANMVLLLIGNHGSVLATDLSQHNTRHALASVLFTDLQPEGPDA